jgi:hypothetical protein
LPTDNCAQSAPPEESQMNKTSMDALNRGWAIGFGTRIHPQNADFDYALRRGDIIVPEALPPASSLLHRLAGYASGAEVFVAMLGRRVAH